MLLKKFVAVGLLGGLTLGLVACGASSNANKAADPLMDSSAGIKPVAGFYGENLSSEEELGLLNMK